MKRQTPAGHAGAGRDNYFPGERKYPDCSPALTSSQHARLLHPLIDARRVHARFRAHEAFVADELRRIEIKHGLTIQRSWNPDLGHSSSSSLTQSTGRGLPCLSANRWEGGS